MRTGAVCGSCWLASAHQRNFSRVILKTSCCVLSSSSYFCKSIFKWSGPSARPAPLPSPPASPKVIGFSLLFLVNLHHARKTHRQILRWVAIKVFYCRLQTMVVKRVRSSLTFPWCLEFIAFCLQLYWVLELHNACARQRNLGGSVCTLTLWPNARTFLNLASGMLGQPIHICIAFSYMWVERRVCIMERNQESRDPVTVAVSSLGCEHFRVWQPMLTYTYPSRGLCGGDLLINV